MSKYIVDEIELLDCEKDELDDVEEYVRSTGFSVNDIKTWWSLEGEFMYSYPVLFSR